ncbi:MMPL family transporter [Corynebacterium sp. 320]|uniref:MMPL family transporter n=1 Tax=Corynebacterium TaxID=1716 RepID=UPI00125CA6D7|nr:MULTISPECIES: MMPL family transporter [Corynebacterium]KAB1504403.1 MMPL family transporter [Corynebacterium sp. 320]KAB1552498.1 MMPL family transporter [Corynebacterium sp. 321]KAB1554287.1 MMPL family transporter [Corynebacterium sp. 319]KAB3528539.1 MMPL family transporter [Corynebacterium sp. 250]KAB3539969.1 MMPL family transporter [Corynebacterium sp. 366]
MIASFVQRHATLVVAAWIVLCALGGFGALQLNDVVKAGGFNDQNGQSFAGQEANRHAFNDPENELSVVLTSDKQIDASVVDKVEESVKTLPNIGAVTDGRQAPQLASDSGHTHIVQVGVKADNTTTQNMVPMLREKVSEALADTAVGSHVTGAAALDYDLNIQSQQDALHAEMIAFPLLILVLLVIYRAIGPTILTLIIAGVCLMGTQGAGTLLSHFMDVSNMYITGASLIGLAVSVDYCLFLIARYRENLLEGLSTAEALTAATRTAGHAIRFGGLSVIAALCALFIARNMVFSSIAWAGIIVTAIALLALATLVPALISLAGDRLFFGKLPGFHRASITTKAQLSPTLRLALAKPALVALSITIPLALFASPLASITLQVPVASASILPEGKDSRAGIETIQTELNAHELFPTSITFEGAESESIKDVQQRAMALAERLEPLATVDHVFAPGTSTELESPYPLTGSSNGMNYARVMLTSTGLPDSAEAHSMIEEIRKLTQDQAGVYISGATAQGSDFDRLVEQSIPWIIGAVLLISLVLLGWAFRSLLLPILAVVLNGLVVSAAMGLLSLLWRLFTGESINSVTPIVIFAIVFGLSMDYMVLMASRMKEEFSNGADHTRAIALGVTKTSGLVISAAIIMIGVFLSFMVAEISIVRELGLGLAMAVALDALIVRPMLLPSALALMGPKAWGRTSTKTM